VADSIGRVMLSIILVVLVATINSTNTASYQRISIPMEQIKLLNFKVANILTLVSLKKAKFLPWASCSSATFLKNSENKKMLMRTYH
jgi:hypothetical protein